MNISKVWLKKPVTMNNLKNSFVITSECYLPAVRSSDPESLLFIAAGNLLVATILFMLFMYGSPDLIQRTVFNPMKGNFQAEF